MYFFLKCRSTVRKRAPRSDLAVRNRAYPEKVAVRNRTRTAVTTCLHVYVFVCFPPVSCTGPCKHIFLGLTEKCFARTSSDESDDDHRWILIGLRLGVWDLAKAFV